MLRECTGHSNTLLQQHKRKLYIWTSPDGQYQNQIDYILCSQRRSSIQSAKTRPGADCGSDGKASVYNAGDLGLIPGLGRFPGEGNGNPLQYSCLENPLDRGAWCPWGHKESDTTERLHFHFSAATAKSLQSCPTLCDPIDGSPSGPAVPGILQARTLEWVAISSSNA